MKWYLLLFTMLLIIIAGCSGGKSPVTPFSSNRASIPQDLNLSDYEPADILSAGLLGVFSGHIDPLTLSGELVPIRDLASQDVLEVVDITNFLMLAPCTDCARIHSVYLNDDGNITANIGIRHPFEPGDPFKPPTGKNRLDLHIFNIEGIVAMESAGSDSFSALGMTVDTSGLLNASGYTSYLDTALDSIYATSANLHPYVLHFRDYSSGNFSALNSNGFEDVSNPTGNLVMPMGCDEDIRPYVFDFTDQSSVNFTFAIGCTYGISADNKSMRLNPIFRVPQFNKKAASEVYVEIFENELAPGAPISQAILDIKVLDMNHGVVVGENLDEMRAQSDVSQISVYVPSVTSTPVTISSPTPTGGDPRDPMNPLTFQITINNSGSAPMGIYRGLVKVSDSYPTGLNTSPLLSSQDGIERVSPLESPLTGIFNIPEFATYQAFKIDVGGNLPPVADLDVSTQSLESGCTLSCYPGPGTHDPDGFITLYEYDFDYDGVNFNVDASNVDGSPVFIQILNPGSTPIDRYVAMRVTDNGDPALTDIDSLQITITPYDLDLSFVNPAIELPLTWWQHGTFLDPALTLQDNGQLCCVAVQQDYAGPGSHNDCKSAVLSNDGLSWFQSGTSIGTTARINAPIKVAADKGDIDSYCYFGWSEPPIWYPTQGNFVCKNSYPYEYAWFDIPFEHGNEIYGSKASGYIYCFGDANNRIERRKGTTQHQVLSSGGWTYLNTGVSDLDPRLSWVRSIDEDSDGYMFLAYFNSDEKAIKRIRSNDIEGDAWTEGTIWDASSLAFSGVNHPSVDIDSEDKIHVSFVRYNDSTNENQICYTYSRDTGDTFCEPIVVVSTNNHIESTPIVHKFIRCHDVLTIVYEEAGDIKAALSWSCGMQFKSGISISNRSESEQKPDVILDKNGDVIFAWEVTDAVYNGSIYGIKAVYDES